MRCGSLVAGVVFWVTAASSPLRCSTLHDTSDDSSGASFFHARDVNVLGTTGYAPGSWIPLKVLRPMRHQ